MPKIIKIQQARDTIMDVLEEVRENSPDYDLSIEEMDAIVFPLEHAVFALGEVFLRFNK